MNITKRFQNITKTLSFILRQTADNREPGTASLEIFPRDSRLGGPAQNTLSVRN